MKEDTLYLPSLSHFQSGNQWTGSFGSACYRVALEEEQLRAELWTIPLSCERMKERFPEEICLQETEESEEGLARLKAWLEERLAALPQDLKEMKIP